LAKLISACFCDKICISKNLHFERQYFTAEMKCNELNGVLYCAEYYSFFQEEIFAYICQHSTHTHDSDHRKFHVDWSDTAFCKYHCQSQFFPIGVTHAGVFSGRWYVGRQ
jgi:hypothetical protein